jgi:FtsP/CotA-like multicopper oxidase with cupredoxin domain
MRGDAHKRFLAPLTALTAVVCFVGGGAVAPAAPVAINLCAVTGTATLKSSVTVPIWGFVRKGTQANCSDVQGTAKLPGEPLIVSEGDTVTINVTNALPGGHTVGLEIPGVTFAPGPAEAAVGTTLTRSFTASAPGTYLYQSGGGGGPNPGEYAGDFGRQVAMGLYGALIVRPPTSGQAYDTATSAYDVEATVILSQVDPTFNADPGMTFYPIDTSSGQSVDPGCDQTHMRCQHFRAVYWLINGKAYPDTAPIQAPAGTRVLLRYLNAGYDNTSMSLLGMHERVLARDANLLNNPFDADTETIPAGGTEDAIAIVPSGGAPSANGFALFNRNMHVTNGTAPSSEYSTSQSLGGGMLTFIHP